MNVLPVLFQKSANNTIAQDLQNLNTFLNNFIALIFLWFKNFYP